MSPGLPFFARGIDVPSLLVQNDPALLQTVRAAIASVEPDAIVAMQTAGPRPFALQWSAVAAGLAAALGVMALGMACVGVSGVLAYLFDQRTREIAVRIAHGARAADLILLIARDTAGALAAGAIGGLAVSLLAAPVRDPKDASVNVAPREVEVVANGNSSAVLDRLAALSPETVRTEALTLEDIFVSTLQPSGAPA